MACEEAGRDLADAMSAYDRIEDELFRLTLSVDGSDDWTRMDRLMEERGAAFERYQAAVAALFEAERTHG